MCYLYANYTARLYAFGLLFCLKISYLTPNKSLKIISK